MSKQIVAVSRAEYRGVSILETGEGCTVVLGRRRFDFRDLDEAVAFIDAVYSTVLEEARTQAQVRKLNIPNKSLPTR